MSVNLSNHQNIISLSLDMFASSTFTYSFICSYDFFQLRFLEGLNSCIAYYPQVPRHISTWWTGQHWLALRVPVPGRRGRRFPLQIRAGCWTGSVRRRPEVRGEPHPQTHRFIQLSRLAIPLFVLRWSWLIICLWILPWLQDSWCFHVTVNIDGGFPNSARSAWSWTGPEATLWNRAALSRLGWPSLDCRISDG